MSLESPPHLSTLAPVLQPGDLATVMRAGARLRLLDVRTPGEFDGAHIAGAYNVPLDALGMHASAIRAGVDVPVVLVCESGQRARRAEAALRAAGLRQMHVLHGGITAWIAAGHPVVRARPRMSLERQVRIVAGSLSATGAFLALIAHPLFMLLPALVGGALVLTGATGSCALGMLLGRLPFNRPASCDTMTMVRALTTGTIP
ncbi:MAG TPA: rhodanese-like domain-containing protein [Gemmatimonadaceae bacterium]|nr:rhodanese-like domain-containing protein [Gemmatimonadaceae bacterium]